MSSNGYGRQVVVPLTNKSGGGVIAGDVVVIDTTNNDAFTTTTSAATTNLIGIAQETIANNATGRVLVQGYAALVNVNASVTRGHYGATHTVAKQAADAGAARAIGTFCKFLTGGTTPDALVYAVDLLATSLSNPMTTTGDIIYSSDNSGTPARRGIGATDALAVVAGGVPTWSPKATVVNPFLPWNIDINVYLTGATQTNWNTLFADATSVNAFVRQSSGAQNAQVGWDIVISAGTWDIELMHLTSTDVGIYTIAFDGASQGTIDGYSASAVRNVRTAVTGIVVATAAKVRLTLTMATKNGSSSSYKANLGGIQLRRTA